MVKKILKGIVTFFKWTSVVFLGIILIAFISLNIPLTQRYIGAKATNFLNKKTKKQTHIGQIGLNIWFELTLKDVYLPDNNNDTLASFDYVAVDIHFWDLFHDKIHLESVYVEGLNFNVFKNQKDSLYNFNYLIEAFSSPTNSLETENDTSNSLTFLVDAVSLSKVKGNYSDDVSGLFFPDFRTGTPKRSLKVK
ncbi:MAG: hypothetical protein NWP87_04550 [Winogradskyella sp.]|nr:hypothetical protein [Winogradskyella sp.]